MPKGPQGQKRPADVIGNAVHVMRIATGEAEDTTSVRTTEGNRKGGLKGGKARAKKLTPKERPEIAQIAAQARWKKS
ncbi:MAG: RNA-binding protein [Terriglobia bacterium]|nr:RNA-binding protein [Terriglobia bacterium]